MIKVASLFAGIGGFCKAFEIAGAKVVWANEKDANAAKTYSQNCPSSNGLRQMG